MVCAGPSAFFVPNSNNMGVNRLPLIIAIKIWHFELHLGPRGHWVYQGCAEVLLYFCSKLLWYGWASIKSSWPKHFRFDILGCVCVEVYQFFCSKPVHYGCLRTPLKPSNEGSTFWGPQGHWECQWCVEVLHTLSPIGKNQWVIRTLKEAAAICGSGEKKKKGQCCEGAAVPLVYFLSEPHGNTHSLCILSEETKKHVVVIVQKSST